MKLKSILLPFKVGIISLPFLLLACSLNDGRITDTTTETTNTKIGMLFNSDGSPAENAKVMFITVDHNPISYIRENLAIADSAVTDSNGNYSIDFLPEGYYNILGEGESGLSYNDSVYISDDNTNDTISDTLKAPGTLRGVVRLQPGDNSMTVLVLVMGTYVWTAPIDSIGNFALENMAEGTYNVRFFPALDTYDPLNISLSIISEVDSMLPDTIRLNFTGIPIPTGLTVNYDTLTQIVTLSWDKADTTLVKGYNIYRKHSDSAFVKINITTVIDTVYIDSNAQQNQTYDYRLKAVDMNDDEGEKYSESVSIEITTPFELLDSFGGQGTGDGQFLKISDIVVLENGNIIALDYLGHKIQKFDSEGNFLLAWGQEGTGNGEFTNPIAVTVDDSSFIYVLEMLGAGRIQKFDTTGLYLCSWNVGSYCRGVDYCDGKLFVASHNNSPGIQIIDLATNEVSWIELLSKEHSKVVVDSNYTVYTNDESENKILVVDISGNVLYTWGSYGTNDGQFDIPSYMDISPDRKIFVSDRKNGRVQVFSLKGEFITKLTLTEVPDDNVEKCPRGVAFDRQGNLYIADYFYIYKYKVNL